jgi:PleD family two-component response regulator
MGLAGWNYQESVDALLHRADEHLYRAKREGGDKLAV